MAGEINRNLTLWQYVDLPGLLAMLADRRMFFRYPDTFDDPFEGQLSKPVVDEIRALVGEAAEQNRQFFARMSEFQMAVNCWHAHSRESAPMWEAYGRDAGVAIHTSVNRLRASLPPQVELRKVSYIDYERDRMDYLNAITSHTYKRREYEHEREVRALVMGGALDRDGATVVQTPMGVLVPLQPETLVKELVVSPAFCPWFPPILEGIVRKLGYRIEVRGSAISGEPYQIYHESLAKLLVRWEDVGKMIIPRHVFLKATQPKDGNG